MAVSEGSETVLVHNESFGCGEKFASITTKISKYIIGFASIAALALSIVAIVFVTREDTRLNESIEETNSVKGEINACFNDSYVRLQELVKKIDGVETGLTQLITEVKSSLQGKITEVESGLNTRFISVQNQVSDLNTNVNKMGTSLGSFQDSTNKEFLKVWKKFKEVDKEIANLAN